MHWPQGLSRTLINKVHCLDPIAISTTKASNDSHDKNLTHQHTFRHVAHILRRISRTYQGRLHRSHRNFCRTQDTDEIPRYSHKTGSSLSMYPSRCTRWCRSILPSPSWTIRFYTFRNSSPPGRSSSRGTIHDIECTTICSRLWKLHRSSRHMPRSSLRHILYHNCIFRCPFACHCLCRHRCQSNLCKGDNPCRSDGEGSTLWGCQCRTIWRNLKKKRKIDNLWRHCMPTRRLTGIFILMLPPEFDITLVLLGDRQALLLASGDVSAQHLLDLD